MKIRLFQHNQNTNNERFQKGEGFRKICDPDRGGETKWQRDAKNKIQEIAFRNV